ncbi:MAG: M23 family metallopeptidase [Provencibacterium sp.]|jgi:murein DD-endopeptidase MepM/ murein hydrolase activator NlpD|nr:M23 family metallopeptidase [Provencibacterium sp.]
MSNLNQSKFGKFLSSKGFYIALAVCIVGAGAAAWVAVDATMNSFTAQDEKKAESLAPISSFSEAKSSSAADWGFSQLQEAENKVEGVEIEKDKKTETASRSSSSSSAASSSAPPSPAASSEPAEDVWKPSVKPSSSEEPPAAAQPLAFSLPIISEVFNPYSSGELVKNQTLNDWRTHDGIDIKAEKGTEVMACADGVVSRIYDDALWGCCMEIEHSGALVSVYCGLDKSALTLAEGDAVKVKDVIGKVDKIPCEISLQNHLHFGIKQDGKWADPVSTMGLN